jgi:hypothetical protein
MQPFFFKYFDKLFVKGWTIGLGHAKIEDIIKTKKFNPTIKWLKQTSVNHFYADPFFLPSDNDEHKVLVEEFPFDDYYGKITLLTFDKNFTLINKKILLDTQSHLSYPFIFREKGEIYIFPESAMSGKLLCYKYDPQSESLTFLSEIINKPLLDATILKHNNKYWLFGTLSGKDSLKNLHIFFADNLLGPYQPHPLNPVKIDVTASRPAGNFIQIDGTLYRPSQNGDMEYGKSITINKINEISEFSFNEEFYFSIEIDKSQNKGIHTIHTINVSGNTIVIDGGTKKFAPWVKVKYFSKNKTFLHAFDSVSENG